jgi:carboxypeptidase D
MQENGPFLWQPGVFKPVENDWSWHKLANIVWANQPVGAGFSQGTVTATDEFGVAQQFMGFWKNFVDTFSMQGYKVYVTGSSYSGMYLPIHCQRDA